MPFYQYQYLDNTSKKRTGLLEANNEQAAKEKLREQGILLLRLQIKNKISSKQNLKGDHLIAFTVQLSQLVNAGIPLYESLVAIEEPLRNESFHRIILSLCEQIKNGVSLSTAMGSFPDSFDEQYCAMVSAGEAVGELGPILERLTQLLTRQARLRRQIVTALIYPAILAGFALLVVTLLLGFVVPSLEGIFAGRELNGFTNAVLAVSRLMREYAWAYVPVLIAAIFWVVWKIRSKAGRLWIQKTVIRVPYLKKLAIETAMARFCQTMATLLQGGASIIDSLRISRGVMRNIVLETEIQAAEGKIVEGKSLSQELSHSRYIPSLVVRMLSVGEESGTSATMLDKIAGMYEQGVEKTLEQVMALIQPVILILLGIIIGTILLAILLPLTDISSFSM